ncbi:MAG: sulfatase-like hydrolase/transferase [Spirochaetales bacterium]|nr:sulfatase-like hydrolase/transferase [Spirochaetales bacterium]
MRVRKSLLTGGLATAMCLSAALPSYANKSDNFEIEVDLDALARKKSYLEELENFSPKKAGQPNVIVLLADDLGYTDTDLYSNLGCNVKTPNLRRLAESGVLCTNGYSSAPISSPSRAGLITGRNQQRFGFEYRIATLYPHTKGFKKFAAKHVNLGELHMNDYESYPTLRQMKQQGLPESEITMAEILKASGYSTAMIGKWDLGYRGNMLPEKMGFDYSYDFLEAFTLFAKESDKDIVNSYQDNYQDKYIWSRKRMGTCAIRRQGKRIVEKEYLTFAKAREAINFIDEKKADPFYMFLSFSAPHTPFQAPRRYYNMFPEVKDHNKRVYYAMIKALDDAIGDILDKLEREDLLENTLIFFASDNGGAEYTGATENYPLKAGKFSNFEGAIRVPYIVSWPKMLDGGRVYEKPVSTLDFFVTAARAAGVGALPGDRTYDGQDLLPHLAVNAAGEPHKALFWRAAYNKYVRSGDWKLIMDEKHGKFMLYNLSDDITESKNLYEQMPQKAAELKALYDEWEKGTIPPLWPYLMDYHYEVDGETFYYAL